MGSEIGIDLLKQAPGLGVIVFLVITFLKHLTEEGNANRKTIEKQSEASEKMSSAITELRVEISKRGGV